MIYGSVCSGIEAASVAWHPLGWRGAFVSEIDAFPRAVLAHHWGSIPLHGDFTTIQAGRYESIELLVGGTPCQSFSLAGLRGGLADDRGNLALEFLRLAQRLRPRWVVWENVPGVLSSNGGRDFGAILGGLGELGYGWAYRVLDAQYFGVAQRRRRVFVVGCLGDRQRAAAVLFERHSLSGYPAPRREAREGVAPTIASRPTSGGGLGTDFDCDGGLVESSVYQASSLGGNRRGYGTLRANGGDVGPGSENLRVIHVSGDQANSEVNADLAGTLNCDNGQRGGYDVPASEEVAFALRAHGGALRPELGLDNDVIQSSRADASEDGTGRGTLLIPIDLRCASRGEKMTNNRAPGAARGGPAGTGIGESGDPAYTVSERQQAIAIPQAVAFAENQRGELRTSDVSPARTEGGGKPGSGFPAVAFQPRYTRNGRGAPDEVASALTGEAGRTGKGDSAQCVAFNWQSGGDVRHGCSVERSPALHAGQTPATLYGGRYADAPEARPVALLRAVRNSIDEETFARWGSGVVAALQSPEILQREVHGGEVRLPAWSRNWLVYCSLALTEDRAAGAVQSVREAEGEGRASPGWQPPQQLARELGAYLSELSRPGASAQGVLHCLRQAGEGSRILQSALSALEELGQPTPHQVVNSGLAVRRLTPVECEFLQGFPRNYTLIPYRGKPAADGPRYKALGNSFAVPVIRWIGRRIQMVEELSLRRARTEEGDAA